MSGPDDELKRHREAIDALDREILARLSERARHAQAIGRLKEGSGAPAYRPEREAQVLARLAEANPGPLPDESVAGIFRQIMSACLALERRLAIAYLGPPGTFTHAAVARHFGPFVDAVPEGTIDEAFRAAEAGRCDYAVVPVENSTEGAVGRTLDLMCTTDLSVVGEVKLRVQQNLLSRARDLASVARIYSHAQSFAQCVQWLARNLPAVPRPARGRGAGRRRDRGRDRGGDLRRPGARRAHRGRTEQPDALLGARPTAGRRVGPRRDLARHVGAQPPRRGARAARAARQARRVDDAHRVASGAHRPLGIPVLHRPHRPPRRRAGGRGARRAGGARAVPQAPGLLPVGPRTLTP